MQFVFGHLKLSPSYPKDKVALKPLCEFLKFKRSIGKKSELVVWVGDFTPQELLEIWGLVRQTNKVSILTVHISGANQSHSSLQAFFHFLTESHQVEQLFMYYYHTSIDSSVPCLARCLQTNSSLKRLCVRFNGTYDNHNRHGFITALFPPPPSPSSSSSSLMRLDLSQCGLGLEGAEQLAGLLQQQQQAGQGLKELVLKGNAVGDSGAEALALALRGNQTLVLLDLSQNDLHCRACEGLGLLLLGNQTLQTLELRANQIGTRGMALLEQVLRVGNCSLVALDISRNPATFDLAHRLATHRRVSRLVMTLQAAKWPSSPPTSAMRRLPTELVRYLTCFLL
ncbi:hypothetical protein BASA81_016504 [Batrachochytrium salamandrivorans]|nr:hypothetical protein BASA81_016504 [Batrachochytrium salamandrivorans]